MGPGWDAIIASRPEMDDGRHDWERYAMMGRGGGDATRDDAGVMRRARDEGRGGAVVGGWDVWSGGSACVRRMVRLTMCAVCDDSLVGDARDEEASGDA